MVYGKMSVNSSRYHMGPGGLVRYLLAERGHPLCTIFTRITHLSSASLHPHINFDLRKAQKVISSSSRHPRKLFIRLDTRRSNGKDFSLELAIYIPNSILITSCYVSFWKYTTLADYSAQMVLLTLK